MIVMYDFYVMHWTLADRPLDAEKLLSTPQFTLLGRPATNFVWSKICNVPRIALVLSEYLEKYGTAEHPKDLMKHQSLFYQLQDILNDTWRLSDGG